MNRNTKRFAFGIILAILLFTILMACSSLLFKSYMLLTVETDRPCDLTVFYDNGAEEGYCFDDAHLSQGHVLSAGKQTVKIYIPQEGLRRLRLDFGNAPCNIAIYQLEIVPNFTQSYRLSAEEVFHEFGVLNDISQSSCKDGVVNYAVSGTDGFIATSDNLIKENAKISYANFIFRTILLLGFSVCTSVCVVFSKSILHLIKKFGKFVRQNRIAKVIFCFLVTFIVLGACTLLLFKPHIVLTVESDEACDLDVYFDNGAQVGNCFDDAHLVRGHTLSGGKQTVKIYIPRGGLNRLRFDFGNAPCNVWVYDLTIVPSRYRTYCYSPEAVFQTFDVLNDISESSLESEAIKYAVSGADGFIATQTNLLNGKQQIHQSNWQVLIPLILISLCLSFSGNLIKKICRAAKHLLHKNREKLERIKQFCASHKNFFLFEALVTLILAVCFGYILNYHLRYMYLDIGADTFCSNWPSFLFYQNLLREGGGLWTFRQGLGGSIYSSMNFIDPFLSILLPLSPEKTVDGLLYMTVIKYYTLSVFAYLYLKKVGFSEKSVIFGALGYTFCGFFVSWGQHYQFATAFIYLTMCLYGFELWAHDKKWVLLVFSVTGMVLFSAYFSYMILLFLAIYVIFRYFALYRFEIKHFFKYGFSLLGYVLLGMGISALALLPSIYQLLHSARVSGSQGLPLEPCTPMFYFSALLRFFSDSILGINDYFGTPGYYAGQQKLKKLNFYEMPFFYTCILFVILVPLLLKKKSCGKVAKASMITVFLSVIFIGVSGSVFNGFSTIATRWTMVLVPLFCMGICRGIEVLSEDIYHNCRYCLVSAAISGLFLLAVNLFSRQLFGQELSKESKIHLLIPLLVVLLYLVVFSVFCLKRKGLAGFMMTLLVILTIDLGTNAFMSIDWKRSLMAEPESIYFDGTQEALEWIEQNDMDFYRVEKSYRQIDLSDPMAQGYNGEKSYSNTYGANFDEYKKFFNLRFPYSNYFFGFDDKQTLRNTAAGKYLLTRTYIERSGYVFLEQVGDIYIYQNLNCLPLAYLQDQACDSTALSECSMQEKQNRLYSAFITEDAEMLAKYQTVSPALDTIQYTDVPFSRIEDADGNFTGIALNEPTTESLVLRFSFGRGTLNPGEKFCHSITLSGEALTPCTMDTFFIYQEDPHPDSKLEVEISTLGVQQIDWSEYAPYFPTGVSVEKKDDETVKRICENLRQQGMDIQSLKDSHIIGRIYADKAGMLVSSIPFDAGWTVFVDGEETATHIVNLIYLGVELSEGEHIIEFRFMPCGLKAGVTISIISSAVLIAVIIWKRKRTRYFLEKSSKKNCK